MAFKLLDEVTEESAKPAPGPTGPATSFRLLDEVPAKGILARGYDAVGDAGAYVAGKGHELATPVRELASNLNRRLPEWLQDKDLNTATREETEGTGRILAQDVAPTLAAILATGGLGAAAGAGAGVLRAGPLATRLATTGGQVAGGAASGAALASAAEGDPILGGLVGGLGGAIPGALSPEISPVLGAVLKTAAKRFPMIGPYVSSILRAGSKAANKTAGPAASTVPPMNPAAPVAAPAPFNPSRVGMSPDQFGRLSPAAQAAITRQAGTATVARPVNPGLVSATGEASAGVSGQPTSQLEIILSKTRPAQSVQPIKPTLRFGPGGVSAGGPPVPGPAPVSTSPPDSLLRVPTGASLPMARQHVRAEQIMNLPPTGPLPQPGPVGMPSASPMADVLRKDLTLQSALETTRQWGNQRRKGFATGGLIGESAEDSWLSQILQRAAPPEPSATSRLRSWRKRIPSDGYQQGGPVR